MDISVRGPVSGGKYSLLHLYSTQRRDPLRGRSNIREAGWKVNKRGRSGYRAALLRASPTYRSQPSVFCSLARAAPNRSIPETVIM